MEFELKIGSVVFAVGDDKNKKGKERKGKERYKKSQSHYISRSRREAPCERIFNQISHIERHGGRNYLCQI